MHRLESSHAMATTRLEHLRGRAEDQRPSRAREQLDAADRHLQAYRDYEASRLILAALGRPEDALVVAMRALDHLPRRARASVRAFCTLSSVEPLQTLGREAEAEMAARKAASLYRRGGLANRRVAAERLAEELRERAAASRLVAVSA